MAPSTITSWQIYGEKMEIVTEFIFLGSKIAADGDGSHEIKRHFLLGRKTLINFDSALRGRDTSLSTKVHLVKAMGFPVVVYGCESWTIKKAEGWYGEGGGRGVQNWEHVYTRGRFMLKYGKTNTIL